MKSHIARCFNCQSIIDSSDSYYGCLSCGSAVCNKCAKAYSDPNKFFCSICKSEVELCYFDKDLFKSGQKSSHLDDVRVIQRDLVYVVGLPIACAKEDILIKYEFFGQYGPIKKVVVNSANVHGLPNQIPSVSAYITFRHNEDALECIFALESFILEGSPMKASFGTTKYCSSFLRGVKCSNPDCLYLHQCGDQSDSFSKDEITGSCSRFIEMTRPTRPKDYDTYPRQDARPTVLPYRRILRKMVLAVADRNIPLFERLSNPELLITPIQVPSSPGISLNTQLGLFNPPLRAVLDTLITSNKE